jgi:hypothetical protein
MTLTVAKTSSKQGSVAISYGPLLLSRAIPGTRIELKPNLYQKNTSKELFWEFAGGRIDTATDAASNRGLQYLLDAEHPERSLVKVEKHDISKNNQVWESAPFVFTIRAMRNEEQDPVTIDLMPIGFTRLRETYLKTAK